MAIVHKVNGKSVNFGGSSVSGSQILTTIQSSSSGNLPTTVVYGNEILPTGEFGKIEKIRPEKPIFVLDIPVTKGARDDPALTEEEGKLVIEDVGMFFTTYYPELEPDGYIEDDYMVIENFPLPVRYHAKKIPVLMLLTGFPEVPPAGFYVPTNHEATPLLSKVFSAFADQRPPYARVEHLGANNWTWLCNGEKGFTGTWRYTFTTKHGRDSLAGLLAFFHAEINCASL